MKNLMRLTRALLLLVCLLVASPTVFAQNSAGISSDGRDFYIGFVLPSFNKNPPKSLTQDYRPYFKVSAIIVPQYDSTEVVVTYFDRSTGREIAGSKGIATKSKPLVVKLDTSAMRMREIDDQGEYCACHIKASNTVSVTYLSTGANSGGSYLALPTNGLGKSYVVASYNDNPGVGAMLASQAENASGGAMIIAPFDSTRVTITPNARTVDGHVGANSGLGATGKGVPYPILLMAGQCYILRSIGVKENADMSSSTVRSNKPIAVLGFQEDAMLGDDLRHTLETRDFMIEQMIPVSSWDSTGYISVLMKGANPDNPLDLGYGENYRAFSNSSSPITIDYANACLGIQIPLSTKTLADSLPELFNIGCLATFSAEKGDKFSVMEYDLRSGGSNEPYPAESMMSIVPISRWKRSYFLDDLVAQDSVSRHYISFIGLRSDIDKGYIKCGRGGTRPTMRINYALSTVSIYKNIPYHPELECINFICAPGSYEIINIRDKPDTISDQNGLIGYNFMLYSYSMEAFSTDSVLGDYNGDDFFYEYANPAGMTLFSGDAAHFHVSIDSQCARTNICVRDDRKTDRGIRSITILKDSLGGMVGVGKNSINIHFDPVIDPQNSGEVNFSGSDSQVCFSVLIDNTLKVANAAILVTDNAGNLKVLDLHYDPPNISLTPNNTTINFGGVGIGKDTCIDVVITNKESIAHTISMTGKKAWKDFTLVSTTPTLPVQLKGGDSVKMRFCYTAKDSSRSLDTVQFTMDCGIANVQLLAKGATGFIHSEDVGFGQVDTGLTLCKTVIISNIGDLPFTLSKHYTFSGSAKFILTDSAALPKKIDPGTKIGLHFCYAPQTLGFDTATITWQTDIPAPYTQSIKNTTIFTGQGVVNAEVKSAKPSGGIRIYPNPVRGRSMMISFADSREAESDLRIFDVLGREVLHRTIKPSAFPNAEVEIPMSSLQNGIYIVHVTTNGSTSSLKFEVLQ